MNLRRGFQRLTAIVWAFGAGLLFVWSDEVLRNPLANVCTAKVSPPYPECFTEEARRLFESQSLAEQLVGRLRSAWGQIDESKTVRRLSTERYRTTVGSLVRRQLLWGATAWGAYYLLLWVASGFQSSRTGRDP